MFLVILIKGRVTFLIGGPEIKIFSLWRTVAFKVIAISDTAG